MVNCKTDERAKMVKFLNGKPGRAREMVKMVNPQGRELVRSVEMVKTVNCAKTARWLGAKAKKSYQRTDIDRPAYESPALSI